MSSSSTGKNRAKSSKENGSTETSEEKQRAQAKRLKKRRQLQTYLRQSWPRKSSASSEHLGYGDAPNCPQCAVLEMRVDDKTICAHGFDGPCFYCHERPEHLWRCLECEINLCTDDVRHHLRVPLLSTHRLVLRKLPNGNDALGEYVDKGYEKIFYKDWMMAANVVITCDEQEFCEPSCTEEKCDVKVRHDLNCACSREACTCDPVELDYVIYMNDRLLEKCYKTNTIPKVLCLQCEIARRHENYNSMKRLKRAKRIQAREAHSRDVNETMNKLAEAFCNQLNQTAKKLPPTPISDDSVPELTDTEDEGGPLEDDFNNIKPGVIECDHKHDRVPRENHYLFPSNKPKIQADHENDPSFVYLDSPSESESSSSDTDSDDIEKRLARILAQGTQCKIWDDQDSSDESKQSKQSKSKRKRKTKGKKDSKSETMEDKSKEATAEPVVKSKKEIGSEVRSKIRAKKEAKQREHDEIIRKKAELPKNIPNAITMEENPHEDHELTEYTTFNQQVADLLDIRGFNERLNGLGESEEPVSTMEQANEVKQKLVDLKSYASKRYVHALSVISESDVETRKELERMATKQQEVVETTLSDFTIQRNIIEANRLSTLVAQKLQDRKGADGRPLVESLKEITVHKSNTPPVSLRVLNKTQRFTAGKKHSRTNDATKFKIKIRQTDDCDI